MSFDCCWIWKQWGILEKQEWITFYLALLNFPCQIMCLYQRETPEISKNLLCEIFCIDHTNYCWHARHIGSGSRGCGQQRESANQTPLLSDLTNERPGGWQYHYITPTAAMAIKVIFKLRVNIGLDLIATEPVSNKKERNTRGSVRLPALKFGNNQTGPGEKSGTLTPLVRAGQ